MNPANTHTIQDFISIGSSVDITNYKTSILERIGNIEYPVHNILNDYLDELNQLAVTVTLTDAEFKRFQFEPKLLSYHIYGYTDFYFILMILNNICDVKDFNFRRVKVLKKQDLNIINRIINAESKLLGANREKLGEAL